MAQKASSLENYSNNVLGKPLHSKSTDLIKAYQKRFESSIILNAKVVAEKYGANMVLTNHVEEAVSRVLNRNPLISRRREFVLLIGGVLLGAFAEEFLTAILVGTFNSTLIYSVVGILGVSLLFWALHK